MKELFVLIKDRLLNNEPVVLVTITGSSGSTPRGAGARMLVGKGKDSLGTRLWGSIGGGTSEYLAIEEAGDLLSQRGQANRRALEGQTARTGVSTQYTLRASEAADIGARCGGKVSVFFRVLDAAEPGLLELIEKGIAHIAEQKPAWFIMELAVDFSLGLAGANGCISIIGEEPKNLKPLLAAAPVCREEDGKRWFSEPLAPGGIVYVFGGGHIARELVPLLAHLGFRCVVFDDREEFLKPELFPQAEKLIPGDFQHIEKDLSFTPNDYAVIVTRGHLCDLEVMASALASPAAYIGVIGSKSKHEFVREQLQARGFTDQAINAPRVHAPIGVDIKSDTPAEIAVSIAAELILERARSQKF